jgi:hypothetical protein
MMKRQLNRPLNETVVEEEAEPVIEHQLEERTRLQLVLCDLSRDLSPQAVVARKVYAINLMIALASRQELMTRQRRSAPAYKDPLKEESPVPAPDPFLPPDRFPLVCEKKQCIICIGNERLPYKQRTRAFKRVSHMWDHVEDVHLKRLQPGERPVCQHPQCSAGGKGLFFDNIMLFKNHVATIHEIDLRPDKVSPW